MGRRIARESAFQLIYERLVTGEKNAVTFTLFLEKNAADAEYLTSVYDGVDDKFVFLSGVIARYASTYKAERIYKVDMSLLLLAAYEILFVPNIPDAAAINEALELVKVYSTEKSSGFINGILASVVKDKERILYLFEHPEQDDAVADGTGDDAVLDEADKDAVTDGTDA